MREEYNGRRGYAPGFQVLGHEIRQGCVGSKHPAAGHHQGSPSRLKERRRFFSPDGGEIIVSNDDNSVRWSNAVLNDPKSRRQLQQRMQRKINDSSKEAQRQQSQ